MSSLQGIFFDVHPENWGDDEIWTKKLFFDDFPNPSWSVVHPPPMFVAGILQDHPNQHQVCSFQLAGGWPPLFLFAGHRCGVRHGEAGGPESRLQGETESCEAEQNGGPALPSKETPQAKHLQKMDGWKMILSWFFFVVAYFQVLGLLLVSGRVAGLMRGGLLRDNHHLMGLLTTYRLGFIRVYDGLIGVYEPRRANFAMIP